MAMIWAAHWNSTEKRYFFHCRYWCVPIMDGCLKLHLTHLINTEFIEFYTPFCFIGTHQKINKYIFYSWTKISPLFASLLLFFFFSCILEKIVCILWSKEKELYARWNLFCFRFFVVVDISQSIFGSFILVVNSHQRLSFDFFFSISLSLFSVLYYSAQLRTDTMCLLCA